jgi:hypothetical protein
VREERNEEEESVHENEGDGSIYTELDGQNQLLLILSNGWNSAWRARMIKGWNLYLGMQQHVLGVKKGRYSLKKNQLRGNTCWNLRGAEAESERGLNQHGLAELHVWTGLGS